MLPASVEGQARAGSLRVMHSARHGLAELADLLFVPSSHVECCEGNIVCRGLDQQVVNGLLLPLIDMPGNESLLAHASLSARVVQRPAQDGLWSGGAAGGAQDPKTVLVYSLVAPLNDAGGI